MKNNDEPWKKMNITELDYFKKRYLEAQAEIVSLKSMIPPTKELCSILIRSPSDTKIEGIIEDLAFWISYHPSILRW